MNTGFGPNFVHCTNIYFDWHNLMIFLMSQIDIRIHNQISGLIRMPSKHTKMKTSHI
jgi:hypothetical protein